MGLYSWGGGEAYIWNEASVSICGGGGLIFVGAYIRVGTYSRRFTVIEIRLNYGLVYCY